MFYMKINKSTIKEGLNFVICNDKKIIFYKEKNIVKACKNICKHLGGTFILKNKYNKIKNNYGISKRKCK